MWNVLIADDEPKIRQGLKNTLETFDLPLWKKQRNMSRIFFL